MDILVSGVWGDDGYDRKFFRGSRASKPTDDPSPATSGRSSAHSVSGGVLTIGTFALLSVRLSFTSWRFPRSRSVLEGRPAVVIRDGEVRDRVLADERMTRTELLEAARKHGVRDLADVELAVLENDGSISFFSRAESRTG